MPHDHFYMELKSQQMQNHRVSFFWKKIKIRNEHMYSGLAAVFHNTAVKYRSERCMKTYSILVFEVTNTAVMRSVTKENTMDQISEDN